MMTKPDKAEILDLIDSLVCDCGRGDCDHERMPMVDRQSAAQRLAKLLCAAQPTYPYLLEIEIEE